MIGPMLIAFGLVMGLGPLVIRQLKRLQFGQSVREAGPSSHKKKNGTPTLGGILFLPVILLVALIFVEKTSTLWLLLLLTVGYGLIGFWDDYLKVARKHNQGLTAKQKIVCQTVLFALFSWYLISVDFSTEVVVPGLQWSIDLGWMYYVLGFFLVVGTTNSTNLTDGLDGLLTGTSIISFLAYAFLAMAIGNETVMQFSFLFVAALLGFLLFNRNPAKLFMGDTGSLAIGGAIAGMAILTKTELLLLLIGGVYMVETLSVIIQVASFKTRGKRVFKMTPLHHHFELSGWGEWKVVSRFWAASLLCSLLALVLFL